MSVDQERSGWASQSSVSEGGVPPGSSGAGGANQRGGLPGPGGMTKRRDPSPVARSGWKIAGAVSLIAACAAGGVLLYQSAGDSVSVVAVREGVSEGETIERADLVSKEVSGVEGAVSVDDAGSLEGQIAAVDLLPGQVITSGAVTSDPIPGQGERTVGLSLTDPQMPDGLGAGDTVTVIAVPGAEAAAATDKSLDKPTVLVENATVYLVGEPSSESSGQPVTVVVPDDEATRIAAYASSSRVALVEAPTSGG